MKCEEGFFLSNSQCESVGAGITDCKNYDGTASQPKCIKCTSDFFLNDGNCLQRGAPVANCAEYQDTQNKCLSCTDSYLITTDFMQCLPKIKNCKTYGPSTETSKEHSCQVCIDGMTYNIATLACETGTVDKCLEYRNNNDCYKCEPGYFLNKTCQKHDEILKCISYSRDTKNVCDQCML